MKAFFGLDRVHNIQHQKPWQMIYQVKGETVLPTFTYGTFSDPDGDYFWTKEAADACADNHRIQRKTRLNEWLKFAEDFKMEFLSFPTGRVYGDDLLDALTWSILPKREHTRTKVFKHRDDNCPICQDMAKALKFDYSDLELRMLGYLQKELENEED